MPITGAAEFDADLGSQFASWCQHQNSWPGLASIQQSIARGQQKGRVSGGAILDEDPGVRRMPRKQ
jgi:hypothetical protein